MAKISIPTRISKLTPPTMSPTIVSRKPLRGHGALPPAPQLSKYMHPDKVYITLHYRQYVCKTPDLNQPLQFSKTTSQTAGCKDRNSVSKCDKDWTHQGTSCYKKMTEKPVEKEPSILGVFISLLQCFVFLAQF